MIDRTQELILMMSLFSKAVVLFAVCFASPNFLYAQTDFFYSFSDLNGGATNSAVDARLHQGKTGSLFIYYTSNGPANSALDTGAFVDVETSLDGVIEFTSAETFTFDVEDVAGAFITTRYFQHGPAIEVLENSITSLFAFNGGASGFGITEESAGPVFFDQGYDVSADAFLWGKVDFLVVGKPGSSTELITGPGAAGIVNQGANVPATFGQVTFTVIPEPSIASLLTLVVLGTGLRRNRSA